MFHINQCFILILFHHFINSTIHHFNQVLYDNKVVKQVDVPSFSGSFGILANHVPVLAVIKPGVVTVFEEDGTSNRFFGNYSIN